MIIKKYQGKTEKDALEAAKQELGEGLVVMNSKTVKQKGVFRLFKSPYYEVTVAKEEESEKPVTDKKPEKTETSVNTLRDENHLEEKLDSLQSFLQQQFSKQQEQSVKSEAVMPEETQTERVFDEKSDESTNEDEERLNMFLSLMENNLVENEVDSKYARQVVAEVRNTIKPELPMDYIIAGVYQKLILKFGKTECITPASENAKVIFFVGTTGVGKTTTIAKIASRLCVNDKKRVVLLTTDTYRIAAAEQLKTYANILEIPFRIIYDADGMNCAVNDFAHYDYILVDTAGHSQYNDEQKSTIADLIQAVTLKPEPKASKDSQAKEMEKEVYLVLSATTKYKDLLKIADSYKKITDYKLIFTKLDETDTLGNLINLRLYSGAPIAYVTCGQNVPDDIEEFSPQKTVKKLLETK